tara:strand:+ start:719 stop:1651 length:933 start_codon:yes stop_codon:yes gene_type:complete
MLTRLQQLFPNQVYQQVALSNYSCWEIGGPVDWFIEVNSERCLIESLNWLRLEGMPYCVIGSGTNILFDDSGFRGCVLRMGREFDTVEWSESHVYAQSGAWIPSIAFHAARAGLSGLEHTIGIPATVGGLVYMNGGSMRRNISEMIVSVKVMRANGELCELTREECGFSYRKSRFHYSDEIILGAKMKFSTKKAYQEQRLELLHILKSRRCKFPRKSPSCGSVFKSSPELHSNYGPPGKVIEDLGFRGKVFGGICVSSEHANFIINCGGGTSYEVLTIVDEIRVECQMQYGMDLIPEFQYLHPVDGITSL